MRAHFDRPLEGSIHTTRQGCQIQVVEYMSYNDILVKFLDGNETYKWVAKKELTKGNIKNPYYPEVRGVGFFGVGPHKGRVEGDKKAGKDHNLLGRIGWG